jgi:hypothetical protein
MEAAPATAAVIAAATTTTVIATATTTAVAAAAITVRYATTTVTAARVPMSAAYVATSRVSAAIAIPTPVAIATAIAVSAAISIAAPAVPAPPVPRSSADKQAAVEPGRTVVPIRCTGILIIGVIAPLTIRRTVIARINHRWANADSESNLGARRSSGERQNHKRSQQNQPEFPHEILLVPPRRALPGLAPEFPPVSALSGLYPLILWPAFNPINSVFANLLRSGKSMLRPAGKRKNPWYFRGYAEWSPLRPHCGLRPPLIGRFE